MVSVGLAAATAAPMVEKMSTPGVKPVTLAGWVPPVAVNSVPPEAGVLSTHRIAGTARSSSDSNRRARRRAGRVGRMRAARNRLVARVMGGLEGKTDGETPVPRRGGRKVPEAGPEVRAER